MSRTEKIERIEPDWCAYDGEEQGSVVSEHPHRGDDEVPASVADRVDDVSTELDRFALLHGLPAPLLEYVARHASEHRLRKGEALFFKNDASDFLALVLEGQIHEILYGPEGQELIVAAPRAGETVDEAALLDRHRRSFTAIACGPTRVLKLPRRHFPMLSSEPVVRERAHVLLCLRLHRTIDSLESLCLHRLESRLARHLIRMAAPDPGRSNTADILLPGAQRILAAMLNVSRSKLNAQLQAWQRSGLATRTGNRLRVHDLDQLRRKAFMTLETGVSPSRTRSDPIENSVAPHRSSRETSMTGGRCPAF